MLLSVPLLATLILNYVINQGYKENLGPNDKIFVRSEEGEA